MINYRLSKAAINDLNEIWSYTYHKWSKEQADKYYKGIIVAIEFIAKIFHSGKSLEDIKKGYRYSKVKSHLIFYRKSDQGHVEIVRILHQRMDIQRHIE